MDDNASGESLEFVISRSQVQIPSVAPIKKPPRNNVSGRFLLPEKQAAGRILVAMWFNFFRLLQAVILDFYLH